jgi:hypothetical protein
MGWKGGTFPKHPFCFVLFYFLETGSSHTAQASLELRFFLPQSLDYRHEPPCPALTETLDPVNEGSGMLSF